MKRADRLKREEIEKRYPTLKGFLNFFGPDWNLDYPTPEAIADEEIERIGVEWLQPVRRELTDFLQATLDDKELTVILNKGFGVGIYFRKPEEARQFAESIENKLMRRIKAHFDT